MAACPQGLPTLERKRVGPCHAEVSAGYVQLRQRLAHGSAMNRCRTTRPHPLKESDDCSRASSNLADQSAVIALNRQRTCHPALGEMLHQAEKERKITRIN